MQENTVNVARKFVRKWRYYIFRFEIRLINRNSINKYACIITKVFVNVDKYIQRNNLFETY